MKRQGIAGAVIFDAGSSAYITVSRTPPGPKFMGPRWREMFKHAVKEAHRLGLELSLNMGSGWDCGGPWISPEYAAQKLVWSERIVNGPTKFSEVLAVSAGVEKDFNGNPIFYKDVAVQAFKLSSQHKEVRPIKYWKLKSVNELFGYKDKVDFSQLLEQETEIEGECNVKSESLVNLSELMDESGRLTWNVSEGQWLILRFGHTHTGKPVAQCNPGGEGLMLDHLSQKAMDLHFEAMAKTLINDVGSLAGKSLKYFHCDSLEIGAVNWTAKFREEFKKRRGYDLEPYLPVLAGRILDSREISNRFLYDFRKTIGDCIADNHYARFRDLSHRYGIKYHSESGGPHPAPIEGLKCLGRNDIPMGEFWARSKSHRIHDYQRIFVKQIASAAHIYGKKLVAAEGFTTIGPHWEKDPWDLKPVADRVFCEGLNRIFLHGFTHSPLEVGKPGYEVFCGTHFNPNITWWNQAHAWFNYLSRCQFLLMQGLFVADVCYYYGDNVPYLVPLKHINPSLGPGYDYDVTNAEVILTRMSVKKGRIVLPDGMSYRVLVLPERQDMPLDVLRKIAELIRAGATVVGPKPSKTTGLRDYPDCDKKVKKLAGQVWGPCNGKTIKEHTFGKGRVFWGKSLRDILLSDGLKPDFEYTGSQEDTYLDYIHRTLGDTEIYFVANRNNRWEQAECTFRVNGKTPELWEPDTGKIISQTVYDTVNGRTKMPLRLAPYGSVFVVFRNASDNNRIVSVLSNGRIVSPAAPMKTIQLPNIEILGQNCDEVKLQIWQKGRYTLKNAKGEVAKVKVKHIPEPIEIAGAWEISFPAGWGAPESIVLDKLISWSEHSDTGVKYFSGTACYRKEFDIPAELLRDDKCLSLDLGTVRNIAEVTLNGTNLGILWKQPFSVDITDTVKPGRNCLEVEVTNLWPNRIIGDQFLPENKRFTRTNVKKFKRNSPLLTSGLLGPVQIITAKKVTVKF